MEKFCIYYEMAASEHSYRVRIDTESQNNCYQITVLKRYFTSNLLLLL